MVKTYEDWIDKNFDELEDEYGLDSEEGTSFEQYCYDKWESYNDDIADEKYQRKREEDI